MDAVIVCATLIGDSSSGREDGNGTPVEIDEHALSERFTESYTDLTWVTLGRNNRP